MKKAVNAKSLNVEEIKNLKTQYQNLKEHL